MNPQPPCPRIDALSALTDGELREPERSLLEAHVAACAVCAPVLGELRQLHARLATLPATMRDFDLAPQVERLIDAAAALPLQPAAPRQRPRRWQLALLAPGGAAALGFGLWLGASLVPATLGPARAPAAQMAAFSAVPPGALCPSPNLCAGAGR